MEGVNALVTSDRNNETKTRIPTIFGMTHFDALGAWASPTQFIEYEQAGEKKKVPKTVAGLAEYFGERYRINAISAGGLSRQEYVEALSAFLAQQQMLQQNAAQVRMEEGAKKTK